MDSKNHSELLKCLGTGCQREHVDQREEKEKRKKVAKKTGKKEERKGGMNEERR